MRELLPVFCLLVALNGLGQDPIFNSNYSSPLLVNPAFNGFGTCQRYSLSHRQQWPGVQNSYRTTYMSFELLGKHTSNAWGGSLIYDVAGAGDLSTSYVLGNYSKSLKIDRSTHLRFGISCGIGQVGIKWQALTFGDMVDERRGFVHQTNQPLGQTQLYFNANTGLALTGKNYFLGASVFNLTRPATGLLNVYQTELLPRHYSVHGGYVFEANVPQNSISLVPQFYFDFQQEFVQYSGGVTMMIDNLIAGMFYKHQTALSTQIGLELNDFVVLYSFDLNLNQLTMRSLGGHELTIRKSISCERNRDAAMLNCPMFH